MNLKEQIRGGILGLAVGDALGVPVEFHSRDQLKENPVVDMREFGSHFQPRGFWSDDSSLTFCLMESMSQGYSAEDVGRRFVRYLREGYWTPNGSMFDIGRGTLDSIKRMEQGCHPETAGGMDEQENGNGSLMRILPAVFYARKYKDLSERYYFLKRISSLTHMHFRSVFACFVYGEFILELMQTDDKFKAFQTSVQTARRFAEENEFNPYEIAFFERILNEGIHREPEESIKSSGYVIDTIEACYWAFLTTNSSKEALLKVVNLGRDTDTVAAITGTMCGVFYGADSFPQEWLNSLARLNDIEELIDRFHEKITT